MHVEFRLSEIAHTCAFDPESFYRMKQIMALRYKNSYASKGSHRRQSEADLCGSGGATPVEDGMRELHLIDFSALSERAQALRSSGRKARARSSGAHYDFPKELLSDKWTPQLRVQFVFERLVKMESSDLDTVIDRKQHEKQVTTNWDGSGVRTKRYSVTPQEVILAALPASVMDCVVKVRLLQLPPDLGSAALEKQIDDAIGITYRDMSGGHPLECLRESPLCIGVAKITLRELMTVRGGVCIALQPKTGMLRSVEALNLNTVATNGMFGKDVGGSSFFTFQVISFSFGKVSPSKLLLYKEKRGAKVAPLARNGDTETRDTITEFGGGSNQSEEPGSISRQESFQPPVRGGGTATVPGNALSPSPKRPGGEGGSVIKQDSFTYPSTQGVSTAGETVVGRFDSAAVRFVMIPYMTVVDLILKVHDIASWRRPRKTVIVLLMLLLALTADAMDIALVVVGFCLVVSAVRTMTMLYRVPITDTGAAPLTAAVSPGANEDTYAYLYGRHNTMLNALVRARLFFIQGLQEESYFELILIFHTVRRHERRILMSGAATCISMCFFSIETLVISGVISLFVIYPVTVRIPAVRARKSKRKNRVPDTLHTIMKSWMLGAPMRVSRVVQVSLVEPAPRPQAPMLQVNGANGPVQMPMLYTNRSNGGSPSTVVLSDFSRAPGDINTSRYHPDSYNTDSLKTFPGLFLHRRARTMDPEYSGDMAAVARQQTQNASRLAFAIISLTCEPGSLVSNKLNPCGPLLARLHTHFESLRYLQDDDRGHANASTTFGSAAIHSGVNNNNNNVGGKSPRPSVMRQTAGGGSSDFAPLYQRTGSGLSLTPNHSSAVLQDFFRETVNLITFISRSCGLQSFVSPGTEPFGSTNVGTNQPGTMPNVASSDRVPVEFFARAPWIVELSPDDGITATLRAMTKNTLSVKKLPRVAGVSNEARTLALFAAYLLQGSHLSIFSAGTTSNTCAVLVPLEPGSTRFRSLPRPNPCPQRLFHALEEIWRGNFASDGGNTAAGITITPNTVLQIISAYNDEKAVRLSRLESSPVGDDVSPLSQQNSGGQNAQQQKGDQHHTSARTNFFHAFTSPFAPANSAHQQQTARGQAGGGAPRNPVMASTSSYGALGLSREPTMTLNSLPQPLRTDAPSTPLTNQPPQKRRVSQSAPAISGGPVDGEKHTSKESTTPTTGGKKKPKKATPSSSNHNNRTLTPSLSTKKNADAKENSLSISSGPPALAETHRGGALNLSGFEMPYSPAGTSSGTSTEVKAFAKTTR